MSDTTTIEKACEALNRVKWRDRENWSPTWPTWMELYPEDAIRIARSFELEAELAAAQSENREQAADMERLRELVADTSIQIQRLQNLNAQLHDKAHDACVQREGTAIERCDELESELADVKIKLEWEVALKRALMPYQERAVTAESELARVKGEHETLKRLVAPFVKVGNRASISSYDVQQVPFDAWRTLAAAFPTEQGVAVEGKE